MRTRRVKAKYNRFDGGIQEFSSPLLLKPEQTPFCKNVDLRVPGKLKKTLGYEIVGSAGSAVAVKGIGIYEKEDGTSTPIKLVGTVLYKYVSSAWTSISGGFYSNNTDKAEMVNAYIDDNERLYIVTGHNDLVSFTDGTNVSNVASTYSKHIEFFQGRLYLANIKISSSVYPTRVLFSPINADTFDNTKDYFDDFGEPVTALKAYAGNLYIFSENKVSAYDGYALRAIAGSLGTTSARSVVSASGYLMWANRSGFYIYGGEGLPQLISRPVQGIVDVITDFSAISAGITGDGRVSFSIGDITYKGTAYTDAELRYDPLSNTWDLLDQRPFCMYTTKRNSGLLTTYAADGGNDKVYLLDSGYTANGDTISAQWVSAKFGGLQDNIDDLKNFYNMDILYKPQNVNEYLTVEYRLDGDLSWSQIDGTADNVILSGTNDIAWASLRLPANTQAKSIQLRISSDTNSFEIYEIDTEYDVLVETT